MIETFTLVTSTYSYVVKHDTLDDERHILNVGNPNKYPCVVLAIFPRDKTITIVGISYLTECAIGGEMKAGSTGTTHMTKAALKLALHLYPDTGRVELTDNSGFQCGRVNVAIADHNLLLYGKTMYQRRLNAKAVNPKVALTIKNTHRVLKGVVMRQNEDFGLNDSVEKQIKKPSSWHNFFQQINFIVGCGYFTSDRMEQLRGIFKFSPLAFTEWTISLKTIRGWDVEWRIEDRSLKQGGGGGLQVLNMFPACYANETC